MGMLNGLTQAFSEETPGKLPRTPSAWIRAAMKRHGSDPELDMVIKLDKRLKALRIPAPGPVRRWLPRTLRDPLACTRDIGLKLYWCLFESRLVYR